MLTQKKILIYGMMVVVFFTGIVFVKEHMERKRPIETLTRNIPGNGDREINLEAWFEDEKVPFRIEIGERQYKEEDLDVVFEESKQWLDGVWLNKNDSEEKVNSDLFFPNEIPDKGIYVQWYPENFRWIQSDGRITEEGYQQAPFSMKIKVILSYGNVEKAYEYEIKVQKKVLSENEILESKIEQSVMDEEIRQNTEEKFYLPTEIEGKKIQWYGIHQRQWLKVLGFGSLIVILLYFRKEEEKLQWVKQRNAQLHRDYPEVVYRLVLLISSGATVRYAWEKITRDYEKEKNRSGKQRWVYEEMETALREMNYGISEVKAYENFGKRCGSQNYQRLTSLLIQQVKRGTRGMDQLLLQEVREAEVLRKENVRKAAEQAGMQLLLPMILMMMVVFSILIIPAFLSMNL